VIYCGRCGAKVYRWHQKRYSQFFGRCRNECKRYETACPCDLPMAPYEVIDKAITDDIQHAHGADLIETRLTDAVREERIHGINAELVWLAGKFTAKAISREDYLAHQADLMDEAEALQADNSDAIWTPTGETVGQQWARLTDGDAGDDDARLWLLRLGVTYTVECVRPRVRAPGTGCGRNGWLAGEWTVTPSWPAPDDATGLNRLAPGLL
jgi:Recombinase zinc beta ribbon domain